MWMDDGTFAQLVEEDDAVTLACFARCADMKPHHLHYISHKLALNPHQNEMLANFGGQVRV